MKANGTWASSNRFGIPTSLANFLVESQGKRVNWTLDACPHARSCVQLVSNRGDAGLHHE